MKVPHPWKLCGTATSVVTNRVVMRNSGLAQEEQRDNVSAFVQEVYTKRRVFEV